MANFSTHITVAAAASGLLASLCLQVGFVSERDALLLMFMGSIGGILPDIDLHYSYPSRIMFAVFGVAAAFSVIFAKASEWSILELWLAGALCFLAVRYPIWEIFHKYTKHRGMVHSIPTAFIVLFLVTRFSYEVLGKSEFMAWLVGSFAFFGFLVHLLLDELYSVDFMNRRIKRSFGTAVKFYDKKSHTRSLGLIALAILAALFTPDSHQFVDTFTSKEAYVIIFDRLLPSWLVGS